MAKIAWRAGTLMAPLPPVLVSCGTMEKPNVMTAAWTGVVCSEPTLVYVSLRPSRYSHEIISRTKEFVINLPTVELAKQVDLCGVKSGRNVDKFKLAGLTASSCAQIAAPQVAESPISLECRVLEVKKFEKATHDMFLAEVAAVNVDEKYIDENGALHLEKAGLLAYAHGFYYALGKQLGKFGWSVEKKSTKRKRSEREKAEKSTENIKNANVEKKSKPDDKKKGDFKNRRGKFKGRKFNDKKTGESKNPDFKDNIRKNGDDGLKFKKRKPDNGKSKHQKFESKDKSATSKTLPKQSVAQHKEPRKILTLKK